MHAIKTILFPTDESEGSRVAFRAASSLACDLGARLIILEVVPQAVTIYGPPSEDYLNQMKLSLKQLTVDNPNVRVERYVTEGNPAEAIVRAAEETKCDLIVMATHGRTGAKRVVLGSVAETVMRRSRCPVLIIKTAKNAAADQDQAQPHEGDVHLSALEA
jgi:nucleotide-binding universal stress UspA family protein